MADAEVTPAMPAPNEGEKRRSFKLPGAYTILFILIILTAAATWVVPSGSYQYNQNGEPVPGTYQEIVTNRRESSLTRSRPRSTAFMASRTIPETSATGIPVSCSARLMSHCSSS